MPDKFKFFQDNLSKKVKPKNPPRKFDFRDQIIGYNPDYAPGYKLLNMILTPDSFVPPPPPRVQPPRPRIPPTPVEATPVHVENTRVLPQVPPKSYNFVSANRTRSSTPNSRPAKENNPTRAKKVIPSVPTIPPPPLPPKFDSTSKFKFVEVSLFPPPPKFTNAFLLYADAKLSD